MFRHSGSKRYRGAARRGQALVEFALAVPLFILLVMAIFAFGILYENKIALDNAVRSGVRYAATSHGTTDTNGDPIPGNLSPLDPAPLDSIEGHVQNSGGTIQIPNHCIDEPGHCTIDDSATCNNSGQSDGMDICYWDVTELKQCGHYDPTANPPYVSHSGTCNPGNAMVTVRAIVHYQVPVPILSNVLSLFFPDGVPIESSATMRMEQPCGC